MKRILNLYKYSVQQSQQLILVDFNDKLQKPMDKWLAHSTNYIFNQQSYPHRAFSLFLFDQNYKLLLQQRSNAKKTFPLLWANTCCSHQLYHENEDDNVTKYRRSDFYVRKRTQEELNFDLKDTPIELVQKIIYSAKDNEEFGEYECITNIVIKQINIDISLTQNDYQKQFTMDYIYFAKIQQDQPRINGNPQEIQDCKWVSLDEFDQFSKHNKKSFTPWFNLINDSHLLNWWKKFKQNDQSFIIPEKIEKLN